MGIAVPGEEERVEKSLGMLIKGQFTQEDFFSVMGNTEIPARAVPSIVLLLTNQRVLEILATLDPDKQEWGDTELASLEYEKEMDKYKLRLLIENDPKAMLSTIEWAHNYYFALCMRSKDRKIRLEGVHLGTSSAIRPAEEGIPISSRVAHAVGLGKLLTKYEKVYVKSKE